MATQKKKMTNKTKKEKNILIAQNSLKKSVKKNTKMTPKKKKPISNFDEKKNVIKIETDSPKPVKKIDKTSKKVKESASSFVEENYLPKKVTEKKELSEKVTPKDDLPKKLDSNDEEKIQRLEKTIILSKKKEHDKSQRLEKTIRISKSRIKKITVKKEENIEEQNNNSEENDFSKKYIINHEKEIKVGESKEKEKAEREKRKEKRDSRIKELGSTLILNVKEKTSDAKIPSGDEKEAKKKRIKRYLLESIGFSLAITFINILAIWIFNYANYIKLFDVKIVNIGLTILLSLIFNYALSFFVDSLVTELWIKYKVNAKKEGVQDGSKGFNEGKHQEDIKL